MLSQFVDVQYYELEVEASLEMRREAGFVVMLGRLASQRALLQHFGALETEFCNINFDGATFNESSSAGLGAIIRNDRGLVMAAFTQPISLPTSVEMVEVLTARGALCFAKDLGFNKIIVEGDSEVIIKALNNSGLPSSSLGLILKDIKVLSSSLGKVLFSHTRRQGNRVAHGLARMTCNFAHFLSWMEDVPPGVKKVFTMPEIDLILYHGGPLKNANANKRLPFEGPGIQLYYTQIDRRLKTLDELKMIVMEELCANPAVHNIQITYRMPHEVLKHQINYKYMVIETNKHVKIMFDKLERIPEVSGIELYIQLEPRADDEIQQTATSLQVTVPYAQYE
ncbi:hypothetical protein SO802_007927 [Lithocarpus litseifolius]|uniref:RNase H type-1 domain-containing protein n=1 Tax=Lithocarpus litseifolius TaxID=425828 RepID=A0AAW2DTP2_9ROSI